MTDDDGKENEGGDAERGIDEDAKKEDRGDGR